MGKADRLERLDERRVELEGEYREALIAALRRTATGKVGLFGHARDKTQQKAIAPILAELDETAAEIDAIRARFGMEPFALHPEFLAARGPVGPNAVGEPKQAAIWLTKLGADPE
ncbi:hypothetical protein ASE86_04860 [Sphingomonas sp. Leaf33]|uniref:hypothetical protein n=1 Tax=Sphingomonas sp. Leaf33 TaxID=1736215 RepID=UPI0006F78E6A|nr:hypothetical protein [Sphingomonas sp. Leaf33]KQN25559.1 hypothetical protein ASE86_04860 [Sphingomonas sp. Leaf33]